MEEEDYIIAKWAQEDVETLYNLLYMFFRVFPRRVEFKIQPLKIDLTEGSETSAKYNLTPGKYPKEHIQYSEHGESFKSRIVHNLLNDNKTSFFFTKVTSNVIYAVPYKNS
jgi:hypothetical protein